MCQYPRFSLVTLKNSNYLLKNYIRDKLKTSEAKLKNYECRVTPQIKEKKPHFQGQLGSSSIRSFFSRSLYRGMEAVVSILSEFSPINTRLRSTKDVRNNSTSSKLLKSIKGWNTCTIFE